MPGMEKKTHEQCGSATEKITKQKLIEEVKQVFPEKNEIQSLEVLEQITTFGSSCWSHFQHKIDNRKNYWTVPFQTENFPNDILMEGDEPMLSIKHKFGEKRTFLKDWTFLQLPPKIFHNP